MKVKKEEKRRRKLKKTGVVITCDSKGKNGLLITIIIFAFSASVRVLILG